MNNIFYSCYLFDPINTNKYLKSGTDLLEKAIKIQVIEIE